MKLKHLLLFALIAGFFGCSKDANINNAEITSNDPMEREAINKVVFEKLNAVGEFKWEMVDANMVWSALILSDSVLSIGYKPASYTNVNETIHEINIQDEEWVNAKNTILDLVAAQVNKDNPNKNVEGKDLIVYEQKTLPVLDLHVSIRTPELIEKLRSMDMVRYVEPMGYGIEPDVTYNDERSDSGCGYSPDYSIETADYTNTAPSVKIPWNHAYMNITSAWSKSTGRNITVALIDTGTSPNQSKLGSAFNSGYSSGRFIQRLGTHVSGWWWWASNDGPNDQCGHGTQMSGLIAAPRGYGGSSVGVAYNANLLAFRATTDVVINGSSEKDGVSDALVIAGNRSDVKIISMSIGDVFSSGQVADAVRYAYNRGKMPIAAAGTSLSWTSWWGVIFPANMNETVAVTGIKDSPNYVKCNTCHSGSKVDFVAVMQRASDNDRTSLTLAMSGNQPARVGGSSAATATTAGIAALIWARNPNWSRATVLQKMKNASSIYPGRSSNFGWGLIDANAAVQ